MLHEVSKAAHSGGVATALDEAIRGNLVAFLIGDTLVGVHVSDIVLTNIEVGESTLGELLGLGVPMLVDLLGSLLRCPHDVALLLPCLRIHLDIGEPCPCGTGLLVTLCGLGGDGGEGLNPPLILGHEGQKAYLLLIACGVLDPIKVTDLRGNGVGSGVGFLRRCHKHKIGC